MQFAATGVGLHLPDGELSAHLKAGSISRSTSSQAAALPAELWRVGLSSLRHRADDLASPQLLPAPGVFECGAVCVATCAASRQPPCRGRDQTAASLTVRGVGHVTVSANRQGGGPDCRRARTRLWRVVHHDVDQALVRADASGVTGSPSTRPPPGAATTTSLCLSASPPALVRNPGQGCRHHSRLRR